jgi:hypothetical protein
MQNILIENLTYKVLIITYKKFMITLKKSIKQQHAVYFKL